MVKKYVTPISSLKLKMNYCFAIFILFFIVDAAYTIYICKEAESEANNLTISINVPITITRSINDMRLFSFILILNNTVGYNKYYPIVSEDSSYPKVKITLNI